MLMPAVCTIIIVSPVAKENSEEGSVLAEIKSSEGNYPLSQSCSVLIQCSFLIKQVVI